MNALRSEWGAIGNLRFLVSSIGSNRFKCFIKLVQLYTTSSALVWKHMHVLSKMDIAQALFIRPPIYDGPLALNASVGYKFAEVPRITNDLWVINLRATLA